MKERNVMNMESKASPTLNPDRTVLEMLTGRRRGNEITSRRLVGHAYLPVGSDTYEIKLMMLPRHTYFMRQTRDSIHRYMVFAKRFMENGGTKLTNPVGFGRLDVDLKSYVQIYFPLLGRVVYLDLVPKN